jgi:hypothetical protein
LRDLQAGFTGQSEIFTAGTSVQGRPLTGIHIWGSGGKGSKPAVLIHGTVHAREWITTMTTEYFAWQLLTKYASDATVKSLVDKYDYYIIPAVNPDGKHTRVFLLADARMPFLPLLCSFLGHCCIRTHLLHSLRMIQYSLMTTTMNRLDLQSH